MQIAELNGDDNCYDFRRERLIIHRTHPFYLTVDKPDAVAEDDITFVAQLSMDRLQVNTGQNSAEG